MSRNAKRQREQFMEWRKSTVALIHQTAIDNGWKLSWMYDDNWSSVYAQFKRGNRKFEIRISDHPSKTWHSSSEILWPESERPLKRLLRKLTTKITNQAILVAI